MSQSVLVHMCCGPCSLMPVKDVLGDDFKVSGFYYNPNIHPFSEYKKREQGVKDLAANLDLDVIYSDVYDSEKYFEPLLGVKTVSGKREAPVTSESENDDCSDNFVSDDVRCNHCYNLRLKATAEKAKELGYDYFTAALLYSKYQKHDLIVEIAESVSKETGVKFLYKDFRTYWGRGIKHSKKMGLYRQQYCGCVFSLKERNDAIKARDAEVKVGT